MRVDVSLPKCWEDLTSKQVLFVLHLLAEQRSITEFLAACFLEFTGWRVVRNRSNMDFVFKHGKQTFKVDASLFQTLCDELLWLRNADGRCINPKRIGRACGCDRDLYDVTLEQYLYADAFWKIYHMSEDVKHLAMLTACLYRKPRQSFNSDDVENGQYKYFLKYPMHMQAVLLWYSGVKLMLKEKFPDLFESSGDAEMEDYDAEKVFLNTLSALNGGRVVDNPKVLQTPCIEALHELNQLNKRAKQMKKK